jgi:hypothetical protein
LHYKLLEDGMSQAYSAEQGNRCRQTVNVVMCRVETGGNRRVVDGVLKMTGLTEDERLNVLRNNDQLKKERELGKVFLVSPSPCPP